jgi:hypothetical protein
MYKLLLNAKVALQATRRSQDLGLPYNPALRAYNVFEVPVAKDVILAARDLYARHILVRLQDPEGHHSSGEHAWWLKHPGWTSDIGWWSADSVYTYKHMESTLFNQVDLGLWQGLLDLNWAPRLYCPFFVVRSWCKKIQFHKDYDWGCGTQAYTLMTPLEDHSTDQDGHLAYLDAWGIKRIYRYKLGTAVVFGTGFLHATQTVQPGPPRAFLCFTFGSDKPRYRDRIVASIGQQSRLMCYPDGTFSG